MSELKARTARSIANEVDAVLAEKDAEIARLKAIRKVHVEAIGSMEAGLQQDEEEIRHHKYKRCLAMAEWCDAEADVADADGDYEDMRLYQKWHERWLELAEKFKEAK